MKGYGCHQEDPALSDSIGGRWIAVIVLASLFLPISASAQDNVKNASAIAPQFVKRTGPALSTVKNANPPKTANAAIKATSNGVKAIKAKPVMLALNFRDAPIDDILKTFSIKSGLTVIKDPGLQGFATLVSPRPLDIAQAFVILDALLDSRGYASTRANGMLRIAVKRGGGMSGGPGEVMQGGPKGMSGRSNDQTQVFQLQYASAKSVASLINDLFKNALGGVTASGSRNMMGGPGGDDMRGGPGGGFRGGNMGGGFNGGSAVNASSDTASSAASRTSVARASADDYSNSVIVTGPSSQITQISQVIDQIDQPVGSKLITQIFPVQYVDVTEIATVVSGVLTASANGGAGSSSTQSSMPFEMRAMMSGGSSSSSSNQVVASSETNSLIVTATETQLDLTQKVISELDKPKKLVSATYIRTLSNASATDVAQLLVSMYGNKTNVSSSTTSKTKSKTTTSSFGTSSSNSGFGNNGGGGGGGGMGGGF